MFQWLCLVVCVVALGALFAYLHEMAVLMRRSIEMDERFCNVTEDLESAVLSMQVDLTNVEQTIKEMLKKR